MRLGGEVLEECADGVAADTAGELGFERAFPSGGGGREASDERWPLLPTRREYEHGDRCAGDERHRSASRPAAAPRQLHPPVRQLTHRSSMSMADLTPTFSRKEFALKGSLVTTRRSRGGIG